MATGYTGTVHFTSTDPQAVLPADYTFTAGDRGTFTFTATLETAGTQSITATDANNAPSPAARRASPSRPASASTLTVTGAPSTATAGAAFDFTVTAYDPFGNVATGYTGTVDLTSSDPPPPSCRPPTPSSPPTTARTPSRPR